jgi:DNA-binding IclR family transcriptional regulator
VLLAFSPAADEGDALVREAGHAVSLGERDAEVAAIAVPVMGPGGRLVGALSVSGLITRFSEDRRPALLRALDDARAGLEPQLVD